MAQDAVDSYVYFMRATPDGLIKIGYSSRPHRRLPEVKAASGKQVTLLGVIPGGRKQEKAIHWRFYKYRLDGEWFLPDPTLLEFIQAETKPLQEMPYRTETRLTVTVSEEIHHLIRREKAETRRTIEELVNERLRLSFLHHPEPLAEPLTAATA